MIHYCKLKGISFRIDYDRAVLLRFRACSFCTNVTLIPPYSDDVIRFTQLAPDASDQTNNSHKRFHVLASRLYLNKTKKSQS